MPPNSHEQAVRFPLCIHSGRSLKTAQPLECLETAIEKKEQQDDASHRAGKLLGDGASSGGRHLVLRVAPVLHYRQEATMLDTESESY